MTRLFALSLLLSMAFASAAEDRPVSLNGASVYSDRDEKVGSTTEIRTSLFEGVLEARWKAGPQTHGCYGGFSLILPPVAGMNSVLFEVRKSKGAPNPEGLSLSTGGRRRFRLSGELLGPLGETWKAVEISIEDFKVPASEIENLRSIGFTVVKLKGSDLGDGQEGTFEIRGLRLSAKAIPPKRPSPSLAGLPPRLTAGPHGHGAWIYRPSSNHVAAVLAYNQKAPVPVRHLFVYAGSLNFGAQSGTVESVKESSLKFFRASLGPSVQIHANFDAGDGARLGSYPEKEQVRLAETLAALVNDSPDAQGLHLDIEPYVAEALPFYVALKKASKKPLSAAVAQWDENLMKVLDFVVLMGYDLAPKPIDFGARLAPVVASFARDARATQTPFMVGLPFIATTVEYEFRKNRKTGAVENSGFTAASFRSEAYAALKALPDLGKDAFYQGVAVWGFIEETKAGVGPLRNEWGTYPTQISPEAWRHLSEFP